MDTNSEKPDAFPRVGRKSTCAVVSERVREVLRLRIDGASVDDIVLYAAEKQWGVSERQINRYIQKSNELLRERAERKASRIVRLAIEQRNNLYARSLASGDFRTALAALDSISKLQGLDARREVRAINTELARLKRLLGIKANEPTPDASGDEGDDGTEIPANP